VTFANRRLDLLQGIRVAQGRDVGGRMEQCQLLWRGLRARAEIVVVQPAQLPAQLDDGADPRDGERVVAARERRSRRRSLR